MFFFFFERTSNYRVGVRAGEPREWLRDRLIVIYKYLSQNLSQS